MALAEQHGREPAGPGAVLFSLREHSCICPELACTCLVGLIYLSKATLVLIEWQFSMFKQAWNNSITMGVSFQ